MDLTRQKLQELERAQQRCVHQERRLIDAYEAEVIELSELHVGDHEEVRDFELAPGWGQGSADGESWPQSVDKAAIFLCR